MTSTEVHPDTIEGLDFEVKCQAKFITSGVTLADCGNPATWMGTHLCCDRHGYTCGGCRVIAEWYKPSCGGCGAAYRIGWVKI